MQITVEQPDIDEGVALNCDACPIARVTQRKMPPGVMVEVRTKFAQVFVSGKLVKSLLLSREARQFIAAFDAGRPVQPFSFDLPIEGLLQEVRDVCYQD